ncbi:hypothetical protein D2V08_01580 [Flagellimonas lutimaris]|uniref:Uncharacterized protein n=1 Tax=Flagellimonas lutimaris TaxID=475082 RepID=A0A3A1NDJ0_9FLAO|nr:hypothetical protein [Allomuricauda lutimaris]RIV36699.1 hypothetical protein D2V08_01580 [Allomuricauda lutimaris]
MTAKNHLAFLLFLLFLSPVRSQLPDVEELQLIEDAIFLEHPTDMVDEMAKLKVGDTLTLITFSKATGQLLEHRYTSKEQTITELKKTGFRNRYFVLLIGKTALFHMDN